MAKIRKLGETAATVQSRSSAPAAAPVDPALLALQQQLAFMQQFQAPAPIPQVQTPYVAPAYTNPELDPTELAYYDSLASRLNSTYDQAAANNQLQQTQLSTENDVRLEDLTRRFEQMRDKLPGGFAKRGVLNSGIYNNALTEYGTDRSNAFSDMSRQFNNQMAGLQQQAAQLGQTKQTGLADVELQRAAKRNAKAAILRAVR